MKRNKSAIVLLAMSVFVLAVSIFMSFDVYTNLGAVNAALPDCVDDGQPCTVGGTPCCVATSSCSGTFPNTTCQ